MTDSSKNGDSHPYRAGGRPTIGYIVTEIERDWALWPWHGLSDSARPHEINVASFIGKVLAWPHYFIEQANIIYDLIDAAHLDRLIVWTSRLFPRLSKPEHNARAGVPVVTMEGAVKGLPCITYENYRGMRAAMDHLIEVHGYRHIDFVGYIEHHIGFQERLPSLSGRSGSAWPGRGVKPGEMVL